VRGGERGLRETKGGRDDLKGWHTGTFSSGQMQIYFEAESGTLLTSKYIHATTETMNETKASKKKEKGIRRGIMNNMYPSECECSGSAPCDRDCD